MGNFPVKIHYFHSKEDSAVNGEELVVESGMEVIDVEIINDGATFLVQFEGSLDGINWYLLNCINLSTLGTLTQIIVSGLSDHFLSGLHRLRCKINSISVGDITVVGRAVN